MVTYLNLVELVSGMFYRFLKKSIKKIKGVQVQPSARLLATH